MNPFPPLVPRLWDAEEALKTVTLLRAYLDAIWQIHGEAMVYAIAQQPARWNIEDLVDMPPDEVGVNFDGEMPA